MTNSLHQNTQLSIIIVSYNVREFLTHALQSINKALKNISSEIIVVDNASVDGSVESVRKQFPNVKLIDNQKNVGFSAANNQGIKKAKGEYIVIINPDTLVQEDTFTSLIKFMDNHPEVGGATCKILNPDGTFSIDSRHSVPKPSTALWKFLGLNKLFPKSKVFGRYNLTYLDPNETYPVDAISGSFMFLRKKAIDDVGLLDEDFFMYCEDVDYCYRLNEKGWKVYYVPESSIIHYKGESTKKTNIDYVINFNKSLYLFYKKHFHKKSLFTFRWLILIGATLRAILIYFRNFISKFFPNILDLFLLNVTIFLVFYARFELTSRFHITNFWNQYININIITSIIFIGTSYFFNLYERYRISFSKAFKTNFVTFFIVAAITFFLKDFAFSRLVVLISAVISPVLMVLWRLVGLKFDTRYKHHIFNKKTLLVGTGEDVKQVLRKMKNSIDTQYNIVGIASINENDIGNRIEDIFIVTHLDNLFEYCKLENIFQIIFSTHNISYEKILRTMANLNTLNIDFKIIPEKMDMVIGKSSIERFDEVPLIEMDYAYGRAFNKFTKRLFDLSLSAIIGLVTCPFFLIVFLFSFRQFKKVSIVGLNNQSIPIFQNLKKPFKGFGNFYMLNYYILKGKISFVGTPIRLDTDNEINVLYKPGITGINQINAHRKPDKSNIEKYDLYYLKNQGFWLDLEIIFRSLLQK